MQPQLPGTSNTFIGLPAPLPSEGVVGPAQVQAEQNRQSGPVDYSNYMGDMTQGMQQRPDLSTLSTPGSSFASVNRPSFMNDMQQGLGQIGPYGPGMGGMGGLLQQLNMQQSFGGYGDFPQQMGGYGGFPQQMGGYGGYGGYGGFPQQMGGYGGYGGFPQQMSEYGGYGGFPPQMMGGYGGFPPQMMGYGGYGGFPQQMGGYGGYGGFPPQMMGGYGGFPQQMGGYGGFPQQMGGYGGGFDMYGGQRPMVGFGGTPQPTPPSNPYSSMRAVFNQRQQQRAQVQPMQQAPFGGPQQSPPPVLGIGGPGMAQTPSMGQQAQPAQQAGPNNFLSSMFGKMQQANQRAPGMGQPMAMAAVMPQSYDANPEVLPTNYGSDNTFSAAVMPGFGRPNQPGGGGNQGGGLF
jgi:hypothetical protein